VVPFAPSLTVAQWSPTDRDRRDQLSRRFSRSLRPPIGTGAGGCKEIQNMKTSGSTMPGPGARWLRARDAAAVLGVAVGTLADWRCEGKGPPFKRLGRAVVYDLAELNAWMEQRPSFTSTAAAHEAARAQRSAA
jgi:predicted DNA-binding transcriptional regulator AlpA